MQKIITVTDMMRSFSDIIGQVYYKGETYEIKKGANIVARLMPSSAKPTINIGELEHFFNNAPHLSVEELAEFEQNLETVKKFNVIEELGKWE